MLMVGAGDRNAGKTRFACSLIREFCSRRDIIGIKVTAIDQVGGSCPHPGPGCGTCSSLKGNYCITEETDSLSEKDTCKMLAAGAVRVFWLKALKTHLEQGIRALLDTIGYDAISICESNSLRRVVEPGLFVMVGDCRAQNCKPSAKDVVRYADRIVFFDGQKFDLDPDEINLITGRWVCKMKATAIIMAGGNSTRMGQDKDMLLISRQPMIKHIYNQLHPYFNQVLISSNDVSKYDFLGIDVIPDRVADKGPLVGIGSALKVSANEVNFVIACDIPEVDMNLVRRMVKESRDFDAVVPTTGPSQYEPLFAVYKKSTLAAIDKAIAAGNYRIIDPLKCCSVKYIDLAKIGAQPLRNLNTKNDYLEFVGGQDDAVV